MGLEEGGRVRGGNVNEVEEWRDGGIGFWCWDLVFCVSLLGCLVDVGVGIHCT